MSRYRELKFRVMTSMQRRVFNPLSRRQPKQVLLETTGRSSGLTRLTPVGGQREGEHFWLVSEFGDKSHYVRNIQVNPAVRVRIDGTWHEGIAHPLPEDDPQARLKTLPSVNSSVVRAFGTNLLTIRVDLTG